MLLFTPNFPFLLGPCDTDTSPTVSAFIIENTPTDPKYKVIQQRLPVRVSSSIPQVQTTILAQSHSASRLKCHLAAATLRSGQYP